MRIWQMGVVDELALLADVGRTHFLAASVGVDVRVGRLQVDDVQSSSCPMAGDERRIAGCRGALRLVGESYEVFEGALRRAPR